MASVYTPRDRIWQGSNTATTGGSIFLTTVASAGSFNFRDLYANGSVVALYLYDGTSGIFEASYGVLTYGGGGAATDSIVSRVITDSYSGPGTPVAWGAGSRNAICMVSSRSFLLRENALGELTAPQVITARGHLGLGTAAVLNAGTAVNNLVQLLTGAPAKLPAVDGSNLVNLPAAAQPFPSGTKMMFGNTPPTGWVRANATEDRMIKLAVAADTIGNAGGDWEITGLTVEGTTDSHALTIAQIPAHSHGIFASGGPGANSLPVTGSTTPTTFNSGSTGGDGGHSHGLSAAAVGSNSAWRPRFEIWAAATKT